MRLARQVLIDAPAPRVWALIDDERNIPLWMPFIVDTRYPSGKPSGSKLGARFIQTMRENNQTSEYQGEVTGYEPGRMLGLRLTPAAFTADVRYFVAIDPDYECTRLVYTCDTRANSWYGWAMLMLGAKMLGRIADQQLAALKHAAENAEEVVVHGVRGA